MLRSMYSGVSGMKNFQTKLDVIGNNIANVSTVGFKKGRVTFQEMMSQTTSNAQGPTASKGGVNATQVGLGSQLGSIDDLHTQGFRQTTDIPLDIALQGDGMFVVASNTGRPADVIGADGEIEQKDPWDINLATSDLAYTRAGNFYLDTDGTITNPNGNYLLGFKLDEATNEPLEPAQYSTIIIPEDAESFSIQTDGVVNYIDSNGDPQVAGKIAVANFSNPGGLQKAGDNLYLASPNAGEVKYVEGEKDGSASLISGSLEMSNVDLAEEFTEMITAQRGFQANTRIISTSDEILQELVNLKR